MGVAALAVAATPFFMRADSRAGTEGGQHLRGQPFVSCCGEVRPDWGTSPRPPDHHRQQPSATIAAEVDFESGVLTHRVQERWMSWSLRRERRQEEGTAGAGRTRRPHPSATVLDGQALRARAERVGGADQW